MVVMPVWKGQAEVQSRDGSAGLWRELKPRGVNSLCVAMQAVRAVSADAILTPVLTCVAHTGGVEFWRADYGQQCVVRGQPCDIQYQCLMLQELPTCEAWHQPHFESLPNFGLWCCDRQGTVFPVTGSQV